MTEERINQLLPIGSVVMLRDAKKALMVYGIAQTEVETQTVYDYIGVLWPEGNIGADTQFMFNQSDVVQVLYRGLDNDERAEFIARLKKHFAENE